MRKPNKPTGEIKLDLGELYEKQWQFIESKTRYTAYGGVSPSQKNGHENAEKNGMNR